MIKLEWKQLERIQIAEDNKYSGKVETEKGEKKRITRAIKSFLNGKEKIWKINSITNDC